MIKVYQDKTVFNDGFGNCQAACIASILEIPLKDLNAPEIGDPDFHHKLDMMLGDLGYRLDVFICIDDDDDDIPTGYSIMTVTTDRVYPPNHKKAGSKIFHAVVGFDGKLVHDPYPLGSTIDKIHHYEKLTPLTEEQKRNHEVVKKMRTLRGDDGVET